MKKIELLAPAGNLNIGIKAFDAGADAVYLGLKNFSARASATNFTLQELSRLKNYAIKKGGKKIYVALNTILLENEIDSLLPVIDDLTELEIDSIIIQDLGLYYILNKYFSGKIPIHASTQMAIANCDGISSLKKMGIERVVLPREVTLSEMEILKKHAESLGVELEVFIHGALCYSVSGMCLFSGMTLGRSGNRGECAQMCRSHYSGKYSFSCNDLWTGMNVLKLKKIGIDSLKIEGRLKDQLYVENVVSYYRKILDLENNYLESERLFDEEKIKLTFGRKGTSAYFDQKSGRELINTSYPKNLGLKIGIVDDVSVRKMNDYDIGTIKVKKDLVLTEINKDDRLIFLKEEFNKESIGAQISKKLSENKNEIKLEIRGNNLELINKNSVAHLISKGNIKRAGLIDEKSYPLFKQRINIISSFNLLDGQIEFKGFDGFETAFEISVEESKNKSLDDFIKLFTQKLSESGNDRNYQFKIEKVQGINQNDVVPFIPPSKIKEIKNNLYLQYDQFRIERKLIVKEKLNFDELILKDDEVVKITLPPVNFPGSESILFLSKLEETKRYIEGQEKPYVQFEIGNISHLHFVSEILNKLTVRDVLKINIKSSIYLYLASSFSKQFITNYFLSFSNNNFSFSFDFSNGWIEQKFIEGTKDKISKDIPLMISRGCFKKHNTQNGSCHGCKKEFPYTYSVKNGSQNYKIVINDCLTYVFLR